MSNHLGRTANSIFTEMNLKEDPFFWEDYIGCRDGMVYFRHGAYRLVDVVNARYPDPDDPRRTAVLLKFSGTT